MKGTLFFGILAALLLHLLATQLVRITPLTPPNEGEPLASVSTIALLSAPLQKASPSLRHFPPRPQSEPRLTKISKSSLQEWLQLLNEEESND